MSNFSKALANEANLTQTQNGAKTLKSSKSNVLDLFAMGGAYRTRSVQDVITLVRRAFSEDPLLTLRTLFYLRDARGGQGERNFFRLAMKELSNEELVKNNIKHIPTFGRFDDLFSLFDTKFEEEAVSLIKNQFNSDLKSERPSLLGKWLPSENTSSKATRELGKKVRSFLNLSPKHYRKALSSLRKTIKVVERDMSLNNFEAINFEGVPSSAALRYRKAFAKHQETRYAQYLLDVAEGKKTIKASTLYPYDLVHKVFQGESDQTVDLQWKALPDYFEGKESNALVMADVSGSMRGTPMEVSISLAMYIAERNKGPFHNVFMTFSGSPEIQEVVGNTLKEKVINLSQAHWEQNTNLQAAFEKILEVAERTKASQNEIPQTLYIVSDMQFDIATRNNQKTNFEALEKKFRKAGYKLPEIVFWNVNATSSNSPVQKDENGTFLVSGCSPAILKHALNKTVKTPYELMLETVNSERYQVIQ